MAIAAVLVIAAGIYFATKNNAPNPNQANNSFVQYQDQTNGAKFFHNKDWQVTNSYGFSRLQIPSAGPTQFLQISYLPTMSQLSELKFGLASNSKIQVGSKDLEMVIKETQWQMPAGQSSITTKTAYYLWTVDNRKILIQVDPSQDPLSDDMKKVIETLQLGL